MTGLDPRRPAPPLPDMLLALDAEYAEILGLLDRATAVRRIVATVPELVGVDVAWVGEPAGTDQIVLRNTINTQTDQIDGIVVPVGVGLGGRVLTARRPLWVSDYCASPEITRHFQVQAEAEGFKGVIAVPIVANGELLGVLYGANRSHTAFGDRTTLALEQMATRTAAAEVVSERARHAAEVAVHEERRRMALELHDTVGATLFTLGAGIRRLGAEPGLDAEFRYRLSVIEQQAIEAAAALRGSLRVLSAPPEQVALGVAVREHCQAFSDRSGIPARTIGLTELPALPSSRVTALADAARECLLNVEKHAGADSVVVSLFATRDGVAVTVSDDGVGLPGGLGLADDAAAQAGLGPADDATARPGLGLAAVADRLARVGGTLTISTNEDGGATVKAWIPT
jgi:signal transduction histidine kinase